MSQSGRSGADARLPVLAVIENCVRCRVLKSLAPARATRHNWRGRVNTDSTFGIWAWSWPDEVNTADEAKCPAFPENDRVDSFKDQGEQVRGSTSLSPRGRPVHRSPERPGELPRWTRSATTGRMWQFVAFARQG